MPTSNVNTTSPGNTPFTIDVTACNLLPELNVKDFQILINGVFNCQGDTCLNWTKSTPTQLTYNGPVIPAGTPIQIRRKTPNTVVRIINFAERFASALWNKELDRIVRWREEADLNGVGASATITVALPSNDPYPNGWDNDIIQPPTRNAVYDALQLYAPIESPILNGTPRAPTQSDNTNNTTIATTAFVHTRVTNALASSPTLGGNPTATTQTDSTNNTTIATTSFVHTRVNNALNTSPTLGGNPTAPTQPLGTNNTTIATTAFCQTIHRPIVVVSKTTPQSNPDGMHTVVWNVKDTDTNNAFDLNTNTFTVPAGLGGLYNVSFTVLVKVTGSPATALTPVGIYIIVNNTINIRAAQLWIKPEEFDHLFVGSRLLLLPDNSTISLAVTDFGYHGGNINTTISVDDGATSLTIYRVAPA